MGLSWGVENFVVGRLINKLIEKSLKALKFFGELVCGRKGAVVSGGGEPPSAPNKL
jgi:hypothetical protein